MTKTNIRKTCPDLLKERLLEINLLQEDIAFSNALAEQNVMMVDEFATLNTTEEKIFALIITELSYDLFVCLNSHANYSLITFSSKNK